LKITKEHLETTVIYTAVAIIFFTALGKLTIINVIGGVVCSYGISWVRKKFFKK